MSTLLPDLGPKLNYRTASPAIHNRPVYLDLQNGQGPPSPIGSGATTPHGHPLPSYFRAGPGRKEITPVPYAKLLPLCLARSAEGMIASIIMPYVNEMILSFGINENDVGIWSAIAVSPPWLFKYIGLITGIKLHGYRSCHCPILRSNRG
jgi:hypothetical protein